MRIKSNVESEQHPPEVVPQELSLTTNPNKPISAVKSGAATTGEQFSDEQKIDTGGGIYGMDY
jgi:hypothetical protein